MRGSAQRQSNPPVSDSFDVAAVESRTRAPSVPVVMDGDVGRTSLESRIRPALVTTTCSGDGKPP